MLYRYILFIIDIKFSPVIRASVDALRRMARVKSHVIRIQNAF